MNGLNKVTLIGNLGKDPELTKLTSGGQVAKFSMATNTSYKDKEGKSQTSTEWHQVVAWSHLAELAHQYLRKGSPLYMEGHLKNRSYEGKDGKTQYVTEIVADQFLLLDKPSQ
jgi:single-strand DNA-binding protein